MEDKKDKFFFGTEADNMDIEEYLKRINDITKYYNEKGEKYKKKFYCCCFIRIISSAIIPIISLGSIINWSTIIVSVLASLITISEAYNNATRAYEKWTKYRDTCNSLWIEQRQFAIKAGIYSDESKRKEYFVERCELLIAEETGEWRKYIERAREMGK